ncbi:MAG: DUF2478 domain-containing protein [Rhizobiales bacterium]|nr:DUF2478 domain-containing protein [Hyphomicrobiales bacterium]
MTSSGTVRLAAIGFQSGFKIDDFLRRVADRLRADRVILGGTLQENTGGGADMCAAMTLIDIASQRRFTISQDLGPESEGCRLDAHGLSEIGVLLDRSLDRRIELLLINRFGTAEAEGGGLRSVFVRAIDAGIPILTAVRPPYLEAWAEFHGGLALDLPCDLDRVLAWCDNAARELRAARPAALSPTN